MAIVTLVAARDVTIRLTCRRASVVTTDTRTDHFEVIHPSNRDPGAPLMARLTALGARYVANGLRSGADQTGSRMTTLASSRGAREHACRMAILTLGNPMRSFQAKAGREVIEG